MNETEALDFFDRLERELRVAARRPARRRPNWTAAPRAALVAAAIAVGLAAAVLPALWLGGGGREQATGTELPTVGTVLPKGAGTPPRPAPATVVATGRAAVVGAWQLEVMPTRGLRNPKTGERLEPPGLCLMLYVPSPLGAARGAGGGFCGPGELGFRRTPGFSRQQVGLPVSGSVRQVLVFGRAPRGAQKVVLSLPGRVRISTVPQPAPEGFRERYGFNASFYLFSLRAQPNFRRGGRVNWLDADGRLGSRGIALLPPLGK
jgi:hypothetical protein